MYTWFFNTIKKFPHQRSSCFLSLICLPCSLIKYKAASSKSSKPKRKFVAHTQHPGSREKLKRHEHVKHGVGDGDDRPARGRSRGLGQGKQYGGELSKANQLLEVGILSDLTVWLRFLFILPLFLLFNPFTMLQLRSMQLKMYLPLLGTFSPHNWYSNLIFFLNILLPWFFCAISNLVVTCHVSYGTCHVTCVTCHVSHVTKLWCLLSSNLLLVPSFLLIPFPFSAPDSACSSCCIFFSCYVFFFTWPKHYAMAKSLYWCVCVHVCLSLCLDLYVPFIYLGPLGTFWVPCTCRYLLDILGL